jgi:hypothetical protein
MRERPVFFYLGQTSHTHLSFAKLILSCGSYLRRRIFRRRSRFFFKSGSFWSGSRLFRTGAAFGCAAAQLLRAGFAAVFMDALDLLVEGERRAADAAAGAVALLMLLLLLGDPAAAVTGAPRFRRCVGLLSSSLLLELPSSEEEDRLSIVFWLP